MPAAASPESFATVLTDNAGVIASADTGRVRPEPSLLAEQLHQLAAEQLRTAAAFAAIGERREAQAMIRRAQEILNEAEIED